MAKVDPGFAVTYESLPWDAESGPAVMSRRQQLAARGAYRAAVVPEIAGQEFPLPAAVEAAASDALMEITRFDSELSATNLGRDGEFAPLAAVMLRTESAASSQIENVTAGAKALAMAAIQERSGPNAQLVAANVDAMQRAIEMADELSEQTILAAHSALMAGHAYAGPGRYREGQVWIGSTAPTPHTASFVPPSASRVPAAMADLVAFCERADISALVHAAIAHAQFETIHPFADGNGRTGRVLVHVLLRRAGAIGRLTVPVSAGLLVDTGSYFEALTAYREGDAVPIVEQFVAASFAAVDNGRRLDREISDLYAEWEHSLRARTGAAAWRVLPLIVRQPAITARFVQTMLRVSHPTAQHAIEQLAEARIVTPASDNRRNRVWLATGVIDALDAFAARAGRRTANRPHWGRDLR